MAGIGFELRRMLAQDSLLGKAQAYALASVIGSGPWILSIAAMLLIGFGQLQLEPTSVGLASFHTSVTYLMSASLVFTGPMQLAFTRYTADRLFENQRGLVLPNLWGVLLLTLVLAFAVGVAALLLLFQGPAFSPLYRISMLVAFVSLCGIWVIVSFASAIRQYRRVLMVFLVSYSLTVAASLSLRVLGLQGLLLGFAIGQSCLLFMLLALVVHEFPVERLLGFDFLRGHRMYPSLMATGACFSLGLWIDKWIFWADPSIGIAVIGPLRAAPMYDIPTFLSYLTLIPGMAVFLVHLETGVALQCEQFDHTITGGGTLAQIRTAREELTQAVHSGLQAVFKVQGFTTVMAIAVAPEVLRTLGLPGSFGAIFKIQLAAAAIELVLLSVLNVLFYLDQRGIALRISVVFVASNAFFSWASLQLPAAFFGYGLVLSVLLSSLLAWHALRRVLQQLEYQTFMLRPVLY